MLLPWLTVPTSGHSATDHLLVTTTFIDDKIIITLFLTTTISLRFLSLRQPLHDHRL